MSKDVGQSINQIKEKQMKDLLFLDKMLTPIIITLVYQLLLLAAIFGGIVGGLNTGNFFVAVLYAVGGAIAARIWCELLIVLFKMNEALQELRNK